jgi:hypothetical protein
MRTVNVKTGNNMRILYVSKRDSSQDNFNNTRKFVTKFKKKFCPV